MLTDDSQADAVVFGGALSEVHSAGELAWNQRRLLNIAQVMVSAWMSVVLRDGGRPPDH